MSELVFARSRMRRKKSGPRRGGSPARTWFYGINWRSEVASLVHSRGNRRAASTGRPVCLSSIGVSKAIGC